MEDKTKLIREIAYKYQSILKVNFLSDVFMNAIGTEINHDTVIEEVQVKLDKAISDLKELQTKITNL